MELIPLSFFGRPVYDENGNVITFGYIGHPDTGPLITFDSDTNTLIITGSLSFIGKSSISIDNSDSPYNAGNVYVIFADTDGGDITINLPVASLSDEIKYEIKNTGSSGNVVVVDASGSETIDDEETQTVLDYECIAVKCDGIEWWVL